MKKSLAFNSALYASFASKRVSEISIYQFDSSFQDLFKLLKKVMILNEKCKKFIRLCIPNVMNTVFRSQ